MGCFGGRKAVPRAGDKVGGKSPTSKLPPTVAGWAVMLIVSCTDLSKEIHMCLATLGRTMSRVTLTSYCISPG